MMNSHQFAKSRKGNLWWNDDDLQGWGQGIEGEASTEVGGPKLFPTDVTSGRLGVAEPAAVKPSVHNTWLISMLGRAPGLLLLLVVLHKQHVDGAALDLAALVRQYEDQVGDSWSHKC